MYTRMETSTWQKSVLIGTLASLVPIVVLGLPFYKAEQARKRGEQPDCAPRGSYPKMVWSLPLGFALTNLALLPLLYKLGVRNYFAIGAILSVLYSSFGRFVAKVPQEVLCTNPTSFQISALVLWALVYGLIGYLMEASCRSK